MALGMAAVSACGRRGQLISPDALVPAAVQNMQVRQQGDAFRITWQAPGKEVSGRPLRDLAGFRLLRRTVDDGSCASCPDSWKLLSEIDLDLPESGTKIGSTYLYRDRDKRPGDAVQYRLQAFSRSGGVSPVETSPPRRMLPAVSAPAITATAMPTSILLSFRFTPPAGAKLVGYNLYRRSGTDAPALLPVNREPIAEPSWEDQQVQFGQTYRYAATAVVAVSGETVETVISDEQELVFSLPEPR
jgi:hypothetical protein